MGKLSALLVRRRIVFLFMTATVALGSLFLRLAYLQLARNPFFTYLALEQRFRGMPVDPRRGRILDTHGTILADSVASDGVYARPAEVEDAEAAAARLAPILQMEPEELEERLTVRQAEVWLARRVSPQQARAVREAGLPGVYVALRTQRRYPHGTLAAHVLGITGIDNQGLEGLERQYDHLLRGEPGRMVQESDARGRFIPGGLRRFIPTVDGYDLVLTLDHRIQQIAERELRRAVVETRSEFGMLLLVRPRTGEIVALAIEPTFDPNRYQDYPTARRRNVIITDQFEPGSTFKIITGVAALAEGVVRPDERFSNTAVIEIGGGRVRSWRAGGHGTVTFEEAVQQSVNPVFAELGALRLGPQTFYRYVSQFGFGSRLGIDFPGEATGFVPKPGQLRHGELLQWANIGFGQGVAVTPLQMVMAAAAIANDGVLMRPFLVREVRDQQGRLVWERKPEPLRRVVDARVAREFSRIMRTVVTHGSGSRADVEGYRVAGKTGTAQIPEGGRYTEKNMASFLAFAPVDRPELAGIVMLYDLKVYPTYGGVHAAPVMGRVLEQALPLLGVEREVAPQGEAVSEVVVPNVRSFPVEEAERVLRQAGLDVRYDGSGAYVVDQTPKPSARVPRGTQVLLSFYAMPPEWEGSTTVPDVRGQTIDEAAGFLVSQYLILDAQGEGVAVEQDPPPGAVVPRGTPVRVRFEQQAR